jgi:hypothetical protein
MTARQQRHLDQKLARKAAKRIRHELPACCPTQPTQSEERSDSCTVCPSDFFKPLSDAKLAANRLNAQLSTGATSEEGKAIVSQNATQHGLTGKFKVLPSESQSQFDKLLAGFMHSEAPVGDDEIEMVQQMAEALWLSRRSVRLQNDCFVALECGTPEEQRVAHKSLALYLRYQTPHDRAFSRFATELRKRRNERARTERGFVSQKLKEAAERRRQETHATRQALQNVKQEGVEIRNRLAAAKAEALELKNLGKKSKVLSAAA